MIEEKGKHLEEEWVKSICEQLETALAAKLSSKKCVIKPSVRLLHKISLNDFMEINDKNEPHFTNVDIKETDFKNRNMYFKVDLFIGEKKGNKVIPRIVIEAKYRDINTHDPITYSRKAELHKQLYPGLRYGLIIGNYEKKHQDEKYYIPTRCVEFGDNFDFIFLFKGGKELSKKELDSFVEVIEEQLTVAEELEDFLAGKDKKSWYITKKIEFGPSKK